MPHRPIGADEDRDVNRGEADQPTGASDDDQRGTERRELARFDSYGDAPAAIELLSDQGFAVDRMAISGRGLRHVEQVASSAGTAAGRVLPPSSPRLWGALPVSDG